MKAKKKEAAAEKKIQLSIAPRGKKKAVTVVQGLKTCGERYSHTDIIGVCLYSKSSS